MQHAEYTFKKYEEYSNKMKNNAKFTKLNKKDQLLFSKDEFSIDKINNKVNLRVFQKIDIDIDEDLIVEDINFLILEEDNDGLYLTFYSVEGNPYGKNSPLVEDDGFIHAIPIGIKLIEG